MKINLERKQFEDGAIYFTNLFGRRITLSKTLVSRLTEQGKLHSECEVESDWLLTSMDKKTNDKTYTNYYFTCPKPEAEPHFEEVKTDDLPF